MANVAEALVGSLIALGIVWILLIPFVVARRKFTIVIEHTGMCRGCGYALAGLPEGARCPECGLATPEGIIRRKRGWNEWRWSRMRELLLLSPLALLIPWFVPAAWYATWCVHGWSHRAVSRFRFWEYALSPDTPFLSTLALGLPLSLVVYMLQWDRRRARRRGIVSAYAGVFVGLAAGSWVHWDSGGIEVNGAVVGTFATAGMVVGALVPGIVSRAIWR